MEKILTVGTEVLDGDRTPSYIIPDLEINRNAQRALDGSMYVDIMYEKSTLKVGFDALSDMNYQAIKALFPRDSSVRVSLLGSAEVKEYYVDKFNGTPISVQGQLYWQNVEVKLVEL